MSGSGRKPGPLGPFVEGYRAWLLGRSYSPSAVIRSLIALPPVQASTLDGVREIARRLDRLGRCGAPLAIPPSSGTRRSSPPTVVDNLRRWLFLRGERVEPGA
jgi:hypothetical protein